jgi:hypothetical protein
METAYDFPEPGLYFDGCRGAHDIDISIIEMAHDYGWDNADLACEEFLSEQADEAIDYLNSLETRDGHYWGFGENAEGFGLWTTEGDDEDSQEG